MDWSAIEAISSAIGAVGVIVTVAYLAYQIRQNTKSIEGATEQSLMAFEKDTYVMIADNASVFRRGSEDIDALNPDEVVQFTNIVLAEMSLLYSAFVQYERKLISEDVWKAYEHGTVERFRSPGYAAVWAREKFDYPTGFRGAMEKLQSESARATPVTRRSDAESLSPDRTNRVPFRSDGAIVKCCDQMPEHQVRS